MPIAALAASAGLSLFAAIREKIEQKLAEGLPSVRRISVSARFQFTEDAIRKIHKMRKSGCTLRQIARAIGCCRSTLREHFNLGSLRRRFTEEEKRRMIALRKQGRTVQQIAIALGIGESTVGHHVRHLGPVPLSDARPRGRWRTARMEARERVVVLRKRGYTFQKIASVVGMAYTTARAIFLAGGKRPARPHGGSKKTSKEEIARMIALRRAGGSYAYIAGLVGVNAGTVGMILKSHGFPGKIPLLRYAGPVGNRVRGICRVPGCGVWHYGSGLCANHQLQYKQGRIEKNGRLLPSTCVDCGANFPYNPQRQRCDRCRRVHLTKLDKLNRDYRLGYIDEQGRPLPFTCEQCGKKFTRRSGKTRFCEGCAAARPNMLRRQRRSQAKLEARARRSSRGT